MNPATTLRIAIPATALVATLLPVLTAPIPPSAPWQSSGEVVGDDRPYLGLDFPRVREGDSGETALTFTARLTDANGRTKASGDTITAAFRVSSETGNTATAGSDYKAMTGQLTFLPGETEKTVAVSVLGDTEDEDDETLTMRWTTWDKTVLLARYAATGTIEDDDDPWPYVSLTSPSVTEGDAGATTLTFTARLSDANGRTQTSKSAITASYRVSTEEGNTATAGTDYTATSGKVTFAAGETVKTIDVTVHGDTEDEEDETLTLRWTEWANVLLASYTATGTIVDDDEAVAARVAISDAAADEGDAITFAVTLDKAVSGGLSVTPSFSDGTASAGSDYTAGASALVFAGTAGERKTFTVATTEDDDVEDDETFSVALSVSGTSAAVTATATATGTIRNDDAPYLSLNSPSVTEGDDGTATLTFAATLDRASPLAINASYQVLSEGGNTATAGKDYTATSGTLTFAPGETSKTVDVSVTGDTEDEGDETLTMKWTAWDGDKVLLVSFAATGTIVDDDAPPPAEVTIANASADEGKAIAFTVTLDRAVPGGLTVTPSFTDGTATKGTDYTENTTALDFAGTAGETVSFTVATTDDGDEEGDETFTVGLAVSGTTHSVTATSTATGTIKDDEEVSVTSNKSTLTLWLDKTSVWENGNAVTVRLKGRLDGGLVSATTTPVTIGGTATSSDYTISPGNDTHLTAPGDGTTYTVTPKNNSSWDGNKTITFNAAGSNLVTAASTTLTLYDDEVKLSTNVASMSEGDAARTVTVTATAANAYSAKRGLGIYIGHTNDSATEGTDYATVAEHTINIEANKTTGSTSFTLTPTQDNIAEGDESLSITGWFAGGGTVIGTHITLYDDDVSLSVNPTSHPENGGDTTVTVTATIGQSSNTARTVRVKVGKSGDSATEGNDYETVNDFNLTIAANSTTGTATFELKPVNLYDRESDETISVYGTMANHVVNGTSLTLTNDDGAVDFSSNISVTSVGEGSGSKSVTMTYFTDKERGYPQTITVHVGYSIDSATEGTDYTSVDDFTVTIPAYMPSGSSTFTLTPTQDASVESHERITIGGTLGSQSVQTQYIRLLDDDGTSFTLSASETSVAESASATTVTVTATAKKAVSAATEVAVVVGDHGSATHGTDYATSVGGNDASTLTINVASGKTTGTGTFTVTPTQDTSVEGNETISINGSSTGHSITNTSLTLIDDDTHAITLSASPDSVAEDDAATSVTVTATAGAAISSARTVTVAVGGSGTATSGTDYAAVTNFDVTIAANATSGTGTFTLTPTDDSSVEGDETIGISGSGTSMTVTGTSLTLTEDDTHAITLSASPDSVAENDAATSVTVTATAGSAISTARTVSVAVGGSADGATEGTDYATVADTTITIAANATSGTVTFTLTPTQDTSAEGDESIGITGSGTLMTVTGTSMTLTDDDVRSIGLSVNKASVGEGAGATTVTVTATSNSAVAAATTVTVSVGASGDGATEGTDYSTVNDFTLTIAANKTSGTGTFTLTPTDDSSYEGEESVSVTGSSSPHTVTGTSLNIGNNDGIAIALSASPDSVIEGGGATSVTVKASTGNVAALAAITLGVQVGKSGDSATEGTDYPTVNDFNLTIAKGDSTGTATFSIIPNSDKKDSESSETISVDGSGSPHTITGTSMTLVNATAANPITLSVSPSSLGEAAGATTVTVTARMQASFKGAGDVTVTVGTSGSAKSGTDFAAVSDIELSFSAESPTTATGAFTLTPTDDSVVEDNETVWVDGSSDYGQVVGASVTINDNDGAAITLSANKTSVSESASGTSVTVTATAGAASSNARTVTVAVGRNGDGAIEGTDYSDVSDFSITIAANATTGTGTFTLTPTQDDVVEGSEALSISGSGTGLNVTGTSVTLTDDDTAPDVNLSVSPASVTEGASDPLNLAGGKTVTVTAAFSTTKTYASDQTVTVSVGGSGTATSDTDYDAVSDFDVKISAGQTSGTATFVLTSTDDSVYEGDETIGLAGSATGLTVNSATLTIDENDSAAVTINDASAAEGSSMTFTVTLDNAVQGGLTVTPSFTDSTAVEGTDFDENTTALSFAGTAGETQTFTVSTTQDDVVETNEVFTVGLGVSDAPSGITATDTGTGTINDNASGNTDAATLTIDDASASEGDSITFTVTLDKAVEGGLTVTPSYTNGTAASGDYTANTAGISFTGTADEQHTFKVATTEDAALEGNETITVGLTVSGTTLASRITSTDTGTGTINNDDSAEVTLGDASGAEGDSITFTVTLDKAVQGGLTVTPSFTDGTAVEGTDYDENTTALSFSGTAGETETFKIATTADAVLEANETFTVGLSVSDAPSGVTSTDTGTGTINNDDAAEVTIDDASASEGSEITFTVTLDKAVQGGLTVTPSFTDGTTASGDYTANTAGISFSGTAGETETFTVSTTEDAVLEANETFTVGLTVSDAPSGVTSTDTGTGTINDDDSAEVTIGDASASEGSGITFTVTLDKAVQGGLTVTPSFTDGTAVEGTDYDENTTALTFTGTAGETETFTVSTTGDAVLEADETFQVDLAVSNAPSGVTATDTGTGTINDDDSAEVTIGDASASEGESISFTVTLDKAVQGGLTVTPGYTDGTTESGDYTANTAGISFSGTAGETKTLTVATKEDAVLEGDETFTVGLSVSDAPSGVTATDTGTGTINNDDGAEVTIDDGSASEGDSISFTVTLDKAVQGGLTVTPGYTDGTTESGDYTANTAGISFAGTRGETQTFKVATTEEAVLEDDETFTVALSVSKAPDGVTSTDTGTGTIDNDDSAEVTIADASADEGDAMTLTVTLSEAVQGGLKVTPGFTDGTAVEGTDYDENTGAVSFDGTKGETKTFTVQTTEDAVLEGDETFTVGLTVSDAPSGVTSSDTGTGTIKNDDGAMVTVNDAGVVEGGSLTFTVSLGAAVQGGLKVTPDFTDGTATDGTDYDENTAALSFTGTKGETRSFTVATTQDKVVEGDETFTVGLTVSGTTLDIEDSDTGTGTVRNDDATPAVNLAVGPSALSEGASATAVTVTAQLSNSNTFPEDRTVTVSVKDGTAKADSDYAAVADFDIEIEEGTGSAQATFKLTPKQDLSVEGDETIRVAGTATGLAVNGTNVTLNDDDKAPAVNLVAVPSSVPEGAGATAVTVTATLSTDKTFPQDTTVKVSVGGGTAASGADYAGVTDFGITIPAGNSTGTATFTLAPTADALVEGRESIPVLGTATGLTVNPASMALVDDDEPPAVNLSVDPPLVAEDAAPEKVTVTATFSTDRVYPTDRTVTVSVGGGAGTATSGTDHAAVADFDITIPALGSGGRGAFTLTPIDDEVVEGVETIEVGGASGDLQVNAATLTLDEDDTHLVTLTASPKVIDERWARDVTVVAEAEVAAAWPRPITVAVGGADDSATEGTDYEAVADFVVTIPTGATQATATFTLTPASDGVAEGSEAITVSGAAQLVTVIGDTLTLTDGSGESTGSTASASLAASPSRVEEGAAATTVTVTATVSAASESARTVTVSVGAAGDGATEGTDYASVADFDITIPANVTSATATFTLTPTDDDAVEDDEAISISGASEAFSVTGTAVTLGDDDDGDRAVRLAASPARVGEGATATTVTVAATMDAASASARTVTVSVGAAGDGATEGADYATVADFSVTIPANDTSATATFTLTPTDDSAVEGDETITISGAGDGLTVTGTTLKLVDDDREVEARAVRLTASPARVGEGATATTVTVTATMDAASASARTVSVSVGAANDGAVEGADYATVPDFALTIPASDTSATATFTLAPADDSAVEGDETITISGAGEGLTVTGTALTLTDDDALPEVELATDPASVAEGAPATTVTVTAAFTNGSTFLADRTVTVTVGGAEGSESADHAASPGTDFARVANVAVTIPAGHTSGTATFTLTPTDDSMVEGDETIALAGVAEGLTVTGTALTVTDDDAIPEVNLSTDPASVEEGSDPLAVTLTATFSNGSTFPEDRTVTVAVGAADESTSADHVASPGTDFARVSNVVVTIPAGRSSGTATFTLTPTDDSMVEGDETIALAGVAEGLTVHGSSMRVTDNDAIPEVNLSTDPINVGEGAPATTVTVTATFTNGSTFATDRTVTVTVGGGTASPGTDDAASPGTDFARVSNVAVTIPAGHTSGTATFTLTPTDDSVIEGDESIAIGGSSDGLTVHGTAMTVTDNDEIPEVTLTTDPQSVAEGAPATTVTLTAAFTNGSTFLTDRTVTVTVGGAEGSESADHVASPGTDFARVSSVAVTIPAGHTSGTATFTLTPTDDSMVEGDETITISGVADGLTVHGGSMTVTDDDAIPEVDLSTDPASVEEGSDPLAVTLTATFSNGSTFPEDRTVTVAVGAADESTSADHVAASGTDFARVSDFHVTIPAGHTTATAIFTLRVVDDNIVEGDETIGVAGAADSLTVNHTALTVTDDDDAPEVELDVDPAGLSERAPATPVTVTAEFSNGNVFAEDRTVTVTVDGGTATPGADYAAVPDFDVVVPAGETTGSGAFTLSPTRDDAEEGDETISVAGVSEGLTVHPAAVTLADDNSVVERTRGIEVSLAGIGRTIASQAVDAIGARFEASSRLSWTATASAQSGMGLSGVAGMLGALGMDAPGLGIQGAHGLAGGHARRHGPRPRPRRERTRRPRHRRPSARRRARLAPAPTGGIIALPFGGADGWTLWASGARTDFSGRPGGLSMDGSIGAAYVGIDRRLGSNGVLGVAVSRSRGGVDVASGASDWAGDVDATVTTVHPYLRWSPDGGTDLWGMLGIGRGDIDLADESGAVATNGRLRMGALGLRRDVARLGAVDLAVRADAFTVGMTADEVAGELRAADGRAHRARLILDGSTSWALSSSSRLVPSVEIGARADGGDVETGPGMELGGGLAYVDAGLGLDIAARGRWLAVHRDEHFGEWGGSLSLRRTPADPNRGLSFSAESAWGDDASGVQALWRDQGLRRGDFGFGLRPEEAEDAWRPDRMDMEVAYATPLGGDRGSLKPFGQLRTMGGGSRHLRVGTRFEFARADEGEEGGGRLRLELLGEQRALAGTAASYGAGLNLAGDGLRALGGRLTPFGELLFENTNGHRLRLGTDLQLFGGGGRPPPGAFRLGLAGESYRDSDGTMKYGLVLRGGWEMEQ